jgi:hypothetical protein
VFHRYEALVTAAGETVIASLCAACAGAALVAHLKPAHESPAGCEQPQSAGRSSFANRNFQIRKP